MKLHILTQNLCDLPIPTSRGMLTYNRNFRIQALCKYLESNTTYDVICFQELFTRKSLKKISSVLKDYNVVSTDYWGLNKGGLVMFINKKYKVTDCTYTTFNDKPVYIETIPDLLISKGFQSIIVDGIRIINTHLIESYKIPRVLSIQPKQLQQISDTFVPNQPTVICGDFNVIKKTQKEYFIKFSGALDSIEECTICNDNPNRMLTKRYKPLHEQYDGIYVSKELSITSPKIVLKDKINNVVVSDHYGVECEIEY